ncbi:hypothetical protein NDU88_009038 [Pleurodeles waltl]|uniref:Uncharacterized protein n=1 Tax=Pleurodeles waltl TaxID=8319 RepID=A0AAV7RU49_PLEWA|nr:hypothetical protein NDU88_009038 [Pleurodeles waltl]
MAVSRRLCVGPLPRSELRDSQACHLRPRPPLLQRFSSASIHEHSHKPAVTGARLRSWPLPACGPPHQAQSLPLFWGPPGSGPLSLAAGARQVGASFDGREPTIVAGFQFVADDGGFRSTLRV